MSIIPVAFSVVLVGIPAAAGAYLIVSHFGHRKVSTGVSLLIFAFAVGLTIFYMMPEGRFSGGNNRLIVPLVLAVGLVSGAISGFVSRRRNKNMR